MVWVWFLVRRRRVLGTLDLLRRRFAAMKTKPVGQDKEGDRGRGKTQERIINH